jgi:O-acetyl-ADP-ribose deacetylase (regulator of RNase III)
MCITKNPEGMVPCCLRTYTCGNGIRLRILQGNIAKWQGDCIVNAANMGLVPSNLPSYWRHEGRKDVNHAIHSQAGPGLAQECASLPAVVVSTSESDGPARVASAPELDDVIRCSRGQARITSGHRLSSKHVIHAVGPDYDTSVRCAGGEQLRKPAHEKAKGLLETTYASIFQLANEVEAKSIGIPAISCGVFGFGGWDSVADAADVSIASCLRYGGSLKEVDFILFEDTTVEAWMDAAAANPRLHGYETAAAEACDGEEANASCILETLQAI